MEYDTLSTVNRVLKHSGHLYIMLSAHFSVPSRAAVTYGHFRYKKRKKVRGSYVYGKRFLHPAGFQYPEDCCPAIDDDDDLQ